MTLREKVRQAVRQDPSFGSAGEDYTSDLTIEAIADLLSATGAPAYIRVADDLRGVVRGDDVMIEVPALPASVVIDGVGSYTLDASGKGYVLKDPDL